MNVGEPLPALVCTAMIHVPVTSAALANCAKATAATANNAPKQVLYFIVIAIPHDPSSASARSLYIPREYDTRSFRAMRNPEPAHVFQTLYCRVLDDARKRQLVSIRG